MSTTPQVSEDRQPLVMESPRESLSETVNETATSEERNMEGINQEEAFSSFVKNETGAEDDTREEESEVEVAAESTDDDNNEEQAAPEVQEETELAAAIEKILVTDEKGQREVEIDLSNKEEVLKHIKRSYGMNKFRAERDNYKKIAEENEPRLGQYKKLEEAFEEDGISGVIDTLTEGKFADFKQQIIDDYEIRKFASPDEIRLMEQADQLSKKEKEASKWRSEFEKFKSQQNEEKEQMEIQKITNMTTSVFNKYRFDGKLGNPAQEAKLDKLLFTNLRTELAEKQEAGEEITQDLIESLISDYSNAVKSTIKKEASTKAAKVVENKKTQATQAAQKAVTSKLKSASTNDELEKARKSGNVSEMMSKFFRL